MEQEWTADAIVSLAHEACSGSKWQPRDCQRSVDRLGYWEVRFKHERGDPGYLVFSDHLKRVYKIELWPEWAGPRPDDRVPALNFRLGQQLTVTAIDRDAQVLTVQPSDGPWNLPGMRKAEP